MFAGLDVRLQERKLAQAGLKPEALELLNILQANPYQPPSLYEKPGAAWPQRIHAA